ncbi:MAG TPA: response regulator [Vicinamibacterales bacterium]|jgi:two-component system response regulator|nr:response regulator [Vicinamibacterales bacterium]
MHEILLIEDNADDVDLTLRALRKNKIANDVIIVRDGVEALDYLFAAGQYAGRDPAALPQVVLLDLKLPRLDGLQVLERVRANPKTRLLPIVILTSSTEQRDLLTGYTLGANSYIRKPVEFEQFVDAVHQLGLYWLLLNQRPPLP